MSLPSMDCMINDPWALGLLGYWHLREGHGDEVAQALSHLEAKQDFASEAFLLWLASEAGLPAVTPRADRLEAICDRLATGIQDPRANWLDLGIAGVYLTNLALVYGAVSSYRNVSNSPQAVALLPPLKAALFRDFMQGGKLKSRQGGEQLFSDVVLCSVPFGLMDPGNQIMVESVATLEQRQYRGGFAFSADSALFGGVARADLDALLAWYFSERGETSRARLLLDHQPSPEDVRAQVLSLLARQNLGRLAGRSGHEGPQFLHHPKGHGSRYHVNEASRSPFQPVSGELVTLRAVLRPYVVGDSAMVHLSTNGTTAEVLAHHVGTDGSEGYFEATIGPFAEGQGVTYRWGQSTPWSFVVGARRHAHLVSGPSGVSLAWDQQPGLPVTIATGSTSKAEIRLLDGGLTLVHQGRTLVRSWSDQGLSPATVDLGPNGELLRITWRLLMGATEEFYGMGERFSHIGYRGRRLDSWVFNQYRDQGDKTYIPMPFFHCQGGAEPWGLAVDTDAFAQVGFCDRLDGLVEIVAESEGGGHVPGLTFFDGEPTSINAQWQARSGKVVVPPRWAFGPWMSSNNWDNQRLCLAEVQRTLDLNLPATVVVLEQWSDEATFYVFNDAVYQPKPGSQSFRLEDFHFPAEGRWPDPAGMVKTLHDQGVKVLLWQAPVMKYMDGLPHVQRDADEAFMLEEGYALKRVDGTPYRVPDFEWFKRSLLPDFSNPKATAWWLSKRQYWFDQIGIDGVKTDGGEAVYGDAIDHEGHTGDALRNRYPMDYVSAFHGFVQRQTGGQGVTFSRAGFRSAHTVPAHWAGDERSTFEAFRSSLIAGLSAGFSGVPFWGWDLGGFNGDIPTAELFLRSTAMAAFCPIMQYHAESKGEKNRDRTPWNIAERSGDPRVLSVYRFFAQARMNILPYLWQEALACVSGAPLMRAMAFEYPEQREFKHLKDQYLLGRSLLVAPVVNEGSFSRSVAFPPGVWVGLFDRRRINGARVLEVAAPLDALPVFVRAGSLMALNLPSDFSFPGDVGLEWEGYTNLVLLAILDAPIESSYVTYSGERIDVNLRLEAGSLHGWATNPTAGSITLWLDRPTSSEREVVVLPPGTTTWPSPI